MILSFSLLTQPEGFSLSPHAFYNNTDIIINPDYQLKRMSNGDVLIYNRDKSIKNDDHTFKDIYADLLLAIYRKQSMQYIENAIAKKYFLSDDECRREIKHAINVLTEWRIIVITREKPSLAKN